MYILTCKITAWCLTPWHTVSVSFLPLPVLRFVYVKTLEAWCAPSFASRSVDGLGV